MNIKRRAKAIQADLNIPVDLSKEADMPHFWPENPYDLEEGQLYLYRLMTPDWDLRIAPSGPPAGDYIVRFIKYRPLSDEVEQRRGDVIIRHAFGDSPCAWFESNEISRSTTVKMNGIKERRIFAQCHFLFYRVSHNDMWKGFVSGFEWPRSPETRLNAYKYMEIDANNTDGNMIYMLIPDESTGVAFAETTKASAKGSAKRSAKASAKSLAKASAKAPAKGSAKSSTKALGDLHEERVGMIELLRLLHLSEGETGIFDADFLEDLDEPPPPPTILTRQVSVSISDQMRENTCTSHAISRIVLKAIRNVIPHWFGDLSLRSYCNSSYSVPMMKNISYHVDIANRIHRARTGVAEAPAANNMLIFTFIYKTIVIATGCKGYDSERLINYLAKNWFTPYTPAPSRITGHVEETHRSKYDKGDLHYIYSTFNEVSHANCIANDINVSPTDKERIQHILREFDQTFFSIPGNKMNTYTYTINGNINKGGQSLIQYSIDNNHYVAIRYVPPSSATGHVMVIVDYEIIDGAFIMIIKNSWGDNTGDVHAQFNAVHNKGRIKSDASRIHLPGKLIFMLPTTLMAGLEEITSRYGLPPPVEPVEEDSVERRERRRPQSRIEPLATDEPPSPSPDEPPLGHRRGRFSPSSPDEPPPPSHEHRRGQFSSHSPDEPDHP